MKQKGEEENYVAPRDVLELQLAQVWEEVLGVGRVGVEDNFFELGGHSLLAVRLLARVESVFGAKVPLATLFQSSTVGGLAETLRRSERRAPSSSPLVCIQREGGGRPFFCVHPGGGNVLCYRDLALHLGTERPFYGLQARGLDGLEEPLTSVEVMAARYVEAITSVQPEGPYFLGGWSLGGTIAYEMARQLREQGREVGLLALLDTGAPVDGTDFALTDATLLLNFAQDINLPPENLPGVAGALRQLSPDEQLSYLVEHAKAAGRLPAEVGAEHARIYFRVFKANVRAREAYVSREYPGRLTLFKACEQAAHAHPDEAGAWARLATGGVDICCVPGQHYTMMRRPHVEGLAAELRARLLAAEAILQP